MTDKVSIDSIELGEVIRVSSKNEFIFLQTVPQRKLILSLSDNQGRIVRSVHRWLRYLCSAIGHSITASTVHQYANTIKYFCEWIEICQPYPSLSVDEVIKIVDRQPVYPDILC